MNKRLPSVPKEAAPGVESEDKPDWGDEFEEKEDLMDQFEIPPPKPRRKVRAKRKARTSTGSKATGAMVDEKRVGRRSEPPIAAEAEEAPDEVLQEREAGEEDNRTGSHKRAAAILEGARVLFLDRLRQANPGGMARLDEDEEHREAAAQFDELSSDEEEELLEEAEARLNKEAEAMVELGLLDAVGVQEAEAMAELGLIGAVEDGAAASASSSSSSSSTGEVGAAAASASSSSSSAASSSSSSASSGSGSRTSGKPATAKATSVPASGSQRRGSHVQEGLAVASASIEASAAVLATDPFSKEGRPLLALPVDVGYGRVFWNIREQRFEGEHYATKARGGEGATRVITPQQLCSKRACRDAVTVANRENHQYELGCFYEMVFCKISLLEGLKRKEETGAWGKLRYDISDSARTRK